MLSVIVCTHNPREAYLRQCIDALRDQTLALCEWELLVIDNCSEDPVLPDLTWHARAKTICEQTLGLTRARLRGIRETRGELLVFVDDDNVLDPDFLEIAARILREKPFLGSWSGQCRPKFEQPPPDWSRRYWGNLAIREFEKDVWSNLPRLAATMPCGAGLCIRRNAAERYLWLHETGARAFQLGRTGTSLLSCEDNDLAACACDIGLGVGLIAALKLTHLIPTERMTADYLARLTEGIYYSSTLLDNQRGIPLLERSSIARAVDVLRMARLGQPHRRILNAAVRGRERAIQRLSSARLLQ